MWLAGSPPGFSRQLPQLWNSQSLLQQQPPPPSAPPPARPLAPACTLGRSRSPSCCPGGLRLHALGASCCAQASCLSAGSEDAADGEEGQARNATFRESSPVPSRPWVPVHHLSWFVSPGYGLRDTPHPHTPRIAQHGPGSFAPRPSQPFCKLRDLDSCAPPHRARRWFPALTRARSGEAPGLRWRPASLRHAARQEPSACWGTLGFSLSLPPPILHAVRQQSGPGNELRLYFWLHIRSLFPGTGSAREIVAAVAGMGPHSRHMWVLG